ncbi:CPBP family intramembrane metalloprotease [Flavobacterium sp. WLB]|uniref:CPBP family intramembrane glutamic endopeptidase n=1 Tax=unclassified Flavobacterium TaxID=196869 RepID=UPI0006AB82A0|nr:MULTISPECIES: type II CAAX endopeptidase family protein [unclassified Flavobacterium]KOP37211.1 abortive infection protein [Flavobacterium sp. VMW]OWU88723.1 abortive infection protein [Flavobacterium sp. NLM]PUU68438.1 CPBP family intramembrane metalloprotease [Flavobacterium sp. WLB]
METLTRKQKIFNFPVVKIFLALLTFMAVVIIGQQIAVKLLALTSLDKDYRNLLKGLFVSFSCIFSYILFFKKYEKRTITEFSTKGLAKNIIIGTLIGFVLQSLTILVIYLNGSYSVVNINPVSFILIPFTIMFTVAIIEEILVRGIIFRIVEEKLGSYISLTISAVLFGVFHLANPHGTLISAICITTAGFLFGAIFMYSRNLWMPIALHFAWNFTQSGIFGAITSGNEKTSSLLEAKIQGPEFITGGEFGPEGSVQAIIFCATATIILLVLNHKQNKIIKPYWAK